MKKGKVVLDINDYDELVEIEKKSRETNSTREHIDKVNSMLVVSFFKGLAVGIAFELVVFLVILYFKS